MITTQSKEARYRVHFTDGKQQADADVPPIQEAVFEYTVKLEGALPEDQRATLMQAADDCPVRRTLLKNFRFKEAGPDYLIRPHHHSFRLSRARRHARTLFPGRSLLKRPVPFAV